MQLDKKSIISNKILLIEFKRWKKKKNQKITKFNYKKESKKVTATVLL